jgi:hypothetical protein
MHEHLSSLTITIVYAVYVRDLGKPSARGTPVRWYGRRAVTLPALAIAVAGAVVFLGDFSPAWPLALP